MTPARQGRRKSQAATQAPGNGATIGYEAELWGMADALRGSMDAAEYKHVECGWRTRCPAVQPAYLERSYGLAPHVRFRGIFSSRRGALLPHLRPMPPPL